MSGPVEEAVPGPAGAERPVCPACGTLGAPGARFCEQCGSALGEAAAPAGAVAPAPAPADVGEAATDAVEVAPPDAAGLAAPGAPGLTAPPAAPCRECGGVVDQDGYCTSCGAKAASPRDHVVEQPAPWVAAVCDRGARRRRNEDAVAIAAGESPGSFAVLVVCDGVSSAEESDVASLAAARAARDVLVALSQGQGAPGAADRPDPSTLLAAAAEAANDAVVRATPPDHGDSPASSTLAVAVLDGGLVIAGAVGDSRAYWLPDGGDGQLLTTDDSLAAELIAAGASRAEAEAGPYAHTITRWLGVDSPGHEPAVTTRPADVPGWLLACSDGLWNYSSSPEELAALVHRVAAAAGGDPLATASALVDWANAQGGHDNITVALARAGAPGPRVPETREQVGA
jgi:serine/threonine protein phosphatase PrpC